MAGRLFQKLPPSWASHRTKIVLGLVSLVLLVGVLVLRSSLFSPTVSLAFTGYSEDGRSALFSLTNHTRHWIHYYHARIQFPTSSGWTNYYDKIEMAMIRDINPLADYQGTTLSAALPAGKHRWRAVVRYHVFPDCPPRWSQRIHSLLEFLYLDPSTTVFTVMTEEHVR